MAAVETITFPRCFRLSDDVPSQVQLHLFSDSSTQAKYAVGYLRFSCPDGRVQCSLVASRSRVAPKKRKTIPRLELDAACMAMKLALALVEELDYTISMLKFWIGSMVVLHWIRQPSSKYRDYVAHRIVDITDDLKSLKANGKRKVEVNYVPTKVNIADVGTRRLRLSETTPNSTWQRGPDFLYQTEESWPRSPDEGEVINEEAELRKQVHIRLAAVEVSNETIFHLGKYSSFDKARRIMANVLDFIELECGKPNSDQAGSTRTDTTDLLHRAETILLRKAQVENFRLETEALTKDKPIAKNSRLIQLSPFIDKKNGLLRVGGRIPDAPVAYDTRHPIIINGKSKIGLLIEYHERLGHGPTDHIFRSIRTRG